MMSDDDESGVTEIGREIDEEDISLIRFSEMATRLTSTKS